MFERDGILLAVSEYAEPQNGETAAAEWVRYRTVGDLTITGADSATPYVAQTGIAAISPTPLNTSTSSSSWAQNNSNTFTFHVTPETGFGTDNSVPGETCSFDVLFTQQSS